MGWQGRGWCDVVWAQTEPCRKADVCLCDGVRRCGCDGSVAIAVGAECGRLKSEY